MTESHGGDCLTQHAFDDYALPAGHYPAVSEKLGVFFGKMIGESSKENKADYDTTWYKKSSEVSEVVPITWE